MLKLISLNIEMDLHYATVVPFLTKEMADVVCLQEAPETFAETLTKLGYHTSFAPMCKKQRPDQEITVGLLIASKVPQTYFSVYYHQHSDVTVLYDGNRPEQTLRLPYLVTQIMHEGINYRIVTAHLIDTKDGHEDEIQQNICRSLLTHLTKEPEHLLCGDFNMPRGYNTLYQEVTELYKDSVPAKYKSSLDRDLHRMGKVDIPEKIFDEYMVDYIFTKDDYQAHDVHLVFGISDHAAIVANIERTTPPSHS
jgi:endonuclease/exonuclease/phosphatase family metal-dependent hydrolase